MQTIPDGAEWLLDEFDAERFWSRVNRHGGRPYLDDPLARLDASAEECWLYRDGDLVGGYASFKLHGIQHRAHRIAYRDFGHKLPDDLTIDHLCRSKACMNPTHLEPVTQTENVQRGIVGNITHCPSNHEYTEANTYIQVRRGKPIRICRACLKAQRHEQYLARKARGDTK